MKKIWKIISIILVSIVALTGVLLGGIAAYDSIAFSSFYKEARKEFLIPGLNTNYTPQGLAYSKEKKVFLGSGYDKSNKEGMIYVIDEKSNKSKKVLLSYDNKEYKGHAGGVAIYNDYVFIAESNYIYYLSLNDLLSIEENERVNIKGRFELFVKASFCFTGEGALYVGEFYDKEHGYDTDSSHHIDVSNGTNHAIIVKYILTELIASRFSLLPIEAYSVCDRVQGVAVSPSGKMALSTSWGINNSHIYIHDLNKSKASIKSYSKVNDNKESGVPILLPTYTLDENTLEKDVVAPPMSEDLEYIDGRIYIYNESACNKYIFGKFMRSKNVYSYPMI